MNVLKPFPIFCLKTWILLGCNNGLDIGCGAGSTTRRLATIMGKKARVTGLDISEKLLTLARSHSQSSGQNFLQADAQSYKFEAEGFDLAISRFGVMFFENPFKAFQNIKSGIKKGSEIRFISVSYTHLTLPTIE